MFRSLLFPCGRRASLIELALYLSLVFSPILVRTSFGAPDGLPKKNSVAPLQKSGIKTRGQLLSEINSWLRKHHESKWTMDELIGRTVDESYSFSQGDNSLDQPIEDFLVSLIKDKPFNRPLKLRSTRVTSIRIGKPRVQLSVPLHYSLVVDILATVADSQKEQDASMKTDHWRVALATALAGNKSRRAGSPLHLRESNDSTPQQVLDDVNRFRRKYGLSDFSRDELVAEVADKVAVLDDFFGPADQKVITFLESFLNNKPFPTSVGGGGEWSAENVIIVPSTNERISLAPHKEVIIAIRDPEPKPNSSSDPQVMYFTRIMVSHYTPQFKK